LRIKYRFVALNGVEYRGESDWGSRRISAGADVVILYNPLQPTVNQPLKINFIARASFAVKPEDLKRQRKAKGGIKVGGRSD
jgi:hypothetical protein